VFCAYIFCRGPHMEWLEFRPLSPEVKRQIAALQATAREGAVRARRENSAVALASQLQVLVRDWPRQGLWGDWVDAGR
jgi:hypothetical protein